MSGSEIRTGMAMSLNTCISVFLLFLLYAQPLLTASLSPHDRSGGQRKQYAMYVWRDGFDNTVPSCDETEFLNWKSHSGSQCFTHTWNTHEKRRWLWSTCNVIGREVSVIFLADVYKKLKAAFLLNDGRCSSRDVLSIKEVLTEGHDQVQDLKIYALFSASDTDVSERNMVKYVVWYNDVCAQTARERFDGVAVNNEAFDPCSDDHTKMTYLEKLQMVKDEALKQTHGSLLTHYSMSWHWGQCHHKPAPINWRGKSMTPTYHMIDIFDSIDVQVAYAIFPVISDRAKLAGYDYAIATGKKIYITLYTEKVEPCQISFFPQTCRTGKDSERDLYAAFDAFDAHGIGKAQPCIEYFRGIYSSGGHRDWPAHK